MDKGPLIRKHIVISAGVCRGLPHFRGTKIKVEWVLRILEAGGTSGEITRDLFPQLTAKSIEAVKAYALALARIHGQFRIERESEATRCFECNARILGFGKGRFKRLSRCAPVPGHCFC